MSTPTVQKTMSYAEFLDWADDRMLEWVDGMAVLLGPGDTRHQMIKGLLMSVLRIFVEQHDLGEILPAPYQMKLERSGREPDLLFVTADRRDRFRERYLDGPADLVIEIVSTESRQRDCVEKLAEYEAAGIPEYWLVDPEAQSLTSFQLDGTGQYRPAEPDARGRLHSRVLPGMWLDPDWLWREPLPPALEVLRQLGVLR